MRKPKKIDAAPVEDITQAIYAPGKSSEILLNVVEGHYAKVFNDEGEMVLLDRHTQRTLKIPEETKFYMEILQGYDMLEG